MWCRMRVVDGRGVGGGERFVKWDRVRRGGGCG